MRPYANTLSSVRTLSCGSLTTCPWSWIDNWCTREYFKSVSLSRWLHFIIRHLITDVQSAQHTRPGVPESATSVSWCSLHGVIQTWGGSRPGATSSSAGKKMSLREAALWNQAKEEVMSGKCSDIKHGTFSNCESRLQLLELAAGNQTNTVWSNTVNGVCKRGIFLGFYTKLAIWCDPWHFY